MDPKEELFQEVKIIIMIFGTIFGIGCLMIIINMLGEIASKL